MRHDFCDGKYTVINNEGILKALRHGVPWGRDLIGDNLVYWMLVEVDRLKTQNAEMLKALQRLTHPAADDDDLAYALEVITKATGGQL